MKLFNLRKKLVTASLGAAVAFGAASSAMAANAPLFTYDLDGVAGGTTVVANGLSGTSSEYLQLISPTQFSGSGWVQFSTLTLDSASIPNTSYSNTGLYATFTLIDTLTSGTAGVSGSTYSLNSLVISLFYDANKNNGFVQGNAATSTAAAVTNTGDDKLLGTATLVAGTGTAGLSTTFGAFLNALTDLALTADGKKFFISPDPFYTQAFEGFNSTGNNWQFNALTGGLSIGNATGVVDFQGVVPEPASLALLGVGLLGLGVSRRRK
jgi:hypothetical protein